MKIVKDFREGVVIIRPDEKHIDGYMAIDFKSKLNEIVQNGGEKIVIDLSRLEFIDSSGLGAMVSVLKKTGMPGKVILCGVKDGVRSILELTRLNKVFPIYHSVKEAVASFKE